MTISTEPRPAITAPIASQPVEPTTVPPMTQTARPWADGSTAQLIDHVTRHFKLGREHGPSRMLESVSMTWTVR